VPAPTSRFPLQRSARRRPRGSGKRTAFAISGATSANLTLTGVTIADAALYTVVATNSAGSATASATLTVRAAPVFTVSPLSQNVAAGERHFTSSVTGSPTPALQWRKNGVAFPARSRTRSRLFNVHAGDVARYDVVATSSLGTTTSATPRSQSRRAISGGTYFGKFASTTPNVGSGGEFANLRPTRWDGRLPQLFRQQRHGASRAPASPSMPRNFSLSVPAAAALQPSAIRFQRSARKPVPRSSTLLLRSPFRFSLSTLSPQPTASLTAAAAPAITFHGSLDETPAP